MFKLLFTISLVLTPTTEPTAKTELKKCGAYFQLGPLYRDGVNTDNSSDTWITIGTGWTGGREKLKHLRDLPNLKELVFLPEEDDWCSELASLPQLESIYFISGSATDRGLSHLEKLHHLQAVSLTGATEITDKGLNYLADKDKLRKLSLAGTGITDEGLKHLKELKSLEYLNLEETAGISGNGLKHLRGLTKLRRLRLTGTIPNKDGHAYGLEHLAAMHEMHDLEANFLAVTDEDLVALRNMPHLKYLSLDGNKLTDKGLESLRHLTELESLDLSSYDSGVTSDGLKHLQNLNKLERLMLSGTAIDDDALEHFRKMKNLKYVNVNNTKMTEKGIKDVERLMGSR